MVQRTLAGFPSNLTTYGNGPRKGLLLHCTLAHGGVYSKLGAAVGGALSLTSFDQPGHGRAADWTEEGDLQDRVVEMATDLLTEPMDIIGHSFGGTVALRLAIEHPELVRTLTLIEPVMLAIAKHDTPQIAEVGLQDLQSFYDAFEAGETERAAAIFTRTYGDGRPWEALSEESRKEISKRVHLIVAGDPAVLGDRYNLIGSGKIEQIKAPTLIVDGTTGNPVLNSVFEGLVRRIPNATRVQISQGGHMVPLTRPNAVAREILQLVSQQLAR